MEQVTETKDIFKEAISGLLTFIKHKAECLKCVANQCAEVRFIQKSALDLAEKALETESQVVYKVLPSDDTFQVEDILSSGTICLDKSNNILEKIGLLQWPLDKEGDKYSWEVLSACLSLGTLIAEQDLSEIVDSLDKTKGDNLVLRDAIQAEEDYRQHKDSCNPCKEASCSDAVELFIQAETKRKNILKSDAGKEQYERLKSLENDIKVLIKNKETNQPQDNVDLTLVNNLSTEIKNLISERNLLTSENDKLQKAIIELAKGNNISFGDSSQDLSKIKEENIKLKERNSKLYETADKLRKNCATFRTYVMVSRDLLLKIYSLALTEEGMKFDKASRAVDPILVEDVII